MAALSKDRAATGLLAETSANLVAFVTLLQMNEALGSDVRANRRLPPIFLRRRY